MKKYLLTSVVFLLGLTLVNAQSNKNSENSDYLQVITKRSQKIVDVLGITDSIKYKRVCDIIIDQYQSLSNIHDAHDAKIKEVKGNAAIDKAIVKSEIAKLDSNTDKELSQLHLVYLARLSRELTPAQVTDVKDAMTYKILPLTYTAYLNELPALTDVQKQKIMELLTEAREHAIDAGSAGKKHEWFGKYKGKINNYLSAEGYDMKKAGEEWQKRIKESQQQKG